MPGRYLSLGAALLAAAFAATWLGLQPPAVRPDSAPAGAFSAWVPGAAGAAVATLLAAGLRLEDFPALVCWDRPFADFERYVPITLAVL